MPTKLRAPALRSSVRAETRSTMSTASRTASTELRVNRGIGYAVNDLGTRRSVKTRTA
jgi:hypothetical protein